MAPATRNDGNSIRTAPRANNPIAKGVSFTSRKVTAAMSAFHPLRTLAAVCSSNARGRAHFPELPFANYAAVITG